MRVKDVPFFGMPFIKKKIRFRVSFLEKSQVVINLGMSFKRNKFFGYILSSFT